jgi:ligand-binding sensor domain-containing protein
MPPQQIPPEAPRLEARPIGLPLPPGLTSVMARGDEMWLGTRGLGLARAGKVGVSFLRTHELTEGAERLTVACAGPRECYMATGGTQAWLFDGDHFVQAKIDPEEGARVLAVVEDHRRRVVAIHRGKSGQALRLSRLTDRAWIPIAMQEVEVPHNVPEISFAVFALSGNLWIGLHYKDTDGEDRYYGAAEVDIDEAKVTYHRTFPQGQVQPSGSLPIPNDVTAVLFHPGEMWFATKSGACRVMGKNVKLFTEAEGLESELLRDIEDGPGGEVWVASERGVGRFNGKTWRFERQGPLGFKIRSLARAEHGWVWLGTNRGLVLVAGPQLELFDTGRGLLEGEVIDVAVDRFGRVWALSPKGVTLVER